MKRKNSAPGLEADWLNCRALIIDKDHTSRSLLVEMLRNLGVDGQNIQQAARVGEARRQLEAKHFDVVLCDYHFGPSEMSGQDLLDELRRAQVLPLTTVFIMVTSEASYTMVAEAAESALDSYLLKPHNAQSLAERLALARHRKRSLAPIYQAIEGHRLDDAVRLCVARYHSKQMYWLYAGRLAAELLMRLHRCQDAQELFEALHESRAAPWTRLGIARSQLEIGQLEPARQTLDALIQQEPTYADAYDLMGRAHIECGELTQALETYGKAAELTPGSVARQQRLGMLAYYLNDATRAEQALQASCELGVRSKTFDHQSLVLLALMHFDRGDSRRMEHVRSLLASAAQTQEHPRLRRMLRVAFTLQLAQQRQIAHVARQLEELSREFAEPDFDMEAACNALSLICALCHVGLELPNAPTWIEALAHRFCVSKSSCEFLVRSCARHESFTAIIRQAYLDIGSMAEQAMQHALNHAPDMAAKALIGQGQRTMNVKLLDLAYLVLQRHRDDIAEHEQLFGLVAELRQRFVPHKVPLALTPAGMRAPGALALG